MGDVLNEMQQHLADAGFRSSVVSVQHLPDLENDLDRLLERRLVDRDSYSELVSRYGLDYHFEPPADFPTAQSIIVTVAPQPKVAARFKLRGVIRPAIIPPTYRYDTDETAYGIISEHLSPRGYRMSDGILPGKPLAVHCGLATYGKNNITYIDGLGSFFRLRAFFSDVPCASDNWQELKVMGQCEECVACGTACPTNAIREDRFVVDATRCLAYINEGEGEFPEWIDPGWHNCLVGCMICQDVCPVNEDYKDWIAEGEEFSEEETLMILDGAPQDELPGETREKLRKLDMLGYAGVLQRNLSVLIQKGDKGHLLGFGDVALT